MGLRDGKGDPRGGIPMGPDRTVLGSGARAVRGAVVLRPRR